MLRTALLMQHRQKLVIPDACAWVRLRRTNGVAGIECRAGRGEGKTIPFAPRRRRANDGPRRGDGVTLAGASRVGRSITRRARCGNGTTILSTGRRGGGFGRRRYCLSGGGHNHANQAGGEHYDKYGDDGSDTHGGLLLYG